MAFQNMLDGDCGGQNALMKLGTHFTQDQAFRQDRVNNLPAHFSNADILVNDFLEERFSQNLQSFRMDSLADELRDIDRFSRNPLNQAPNVAQLASREQDALWTEEFLRSEKGRAEMSQNFDPSGLAGAFTDPVEGAGAIGSQFVRAVTNPRASLSEEIGAVGGELMRPGPGPIHWPVGQQPQPWAPQFSAAPGNSQWAPGFLTPREDEFELIDLPGTLESAESKFQKFWQKEGEEDKTKSEEATAEQEEASSFKLRDNIWETEGYGTDDPEWNVEDNQEFWKNMQKMWQSMSNPEGTDSDQFANELGAYVDPFKEYTFETDNPMKELEDPMAEGLKKLEEQDIPSAVLCFEAAAQADPQNALAWQYLGTTQAKNEQDPFAIAAFKQCLNLEPDNLTALQGLSVSYTNENYQNSACQMLREWLMKNPKYKDLPAPPAKQFFGSSLLDSDFHEEVKNFYIAAANMNPVGKIDVDVQCGLGVLFNLSYDYDKAADCFKAALQASPQDYQMWNRLGATLANGNRSEEAVDAYYNALHISPGFIRARYNLGITCINLGSHREAAEHMLTALNQQDQSNSSRGEKGSMSDSIWGTLRLVVSQLGNPELLPAVENRDLAPLNREYKVK